jgi:hypothetical protein
MSKTQFSKETFWSLLSKETTKGIVIPIIQRAYTHGGRGKDLSVEEKSNAFLEYLIDALFSDAKKKWNWILFTALRKTEKLCRLTGSSA